MTRLLRFFGLRRDLGHLWRNPATGLYHDPRVLMRDLCGLPTPLALADVRKLLVMFAAVATDGSGHSEEQVEAAYNAFLEWHEGKFGTGQSSPTSAPSTASPAT